MDQESIAAKRVHLDLALLMGRHRLKLWILLLPLTAVVLFFPADLTFEYHAIQSVHIFHNLPLLGGLFYAWLLLLLLLVFTSKGEKKSHWEGLALSVVFALVFLGFWAVIAPNRAGDGLSNAITTDYISSQGTLSRHLNVAYLDFPGLHILTSSICQITGLEVFDGVRVVLVFSALLFSALLYLLFSRILGNACLAIFAVLLVIQGNWVQSLSTFFYPGYLGLIFVAAFLVLVNRREHSLLRTWQERLVAIVLLAAASMTHLVTSMLFFFVLAGILLVELVSRRRFARGELAQHKPGNVTGWSTITLFLVVPLTWGIYQATSTFPNLVDLFPKLAEDLSEGQMFGYGSTLGKANLGASIALWANMTRQFWLILIYGLGGVLALGSLFRLRRLSSVERKEIGSLAGIVLLGVLGVFLSHGGFEGQRLLLYTPFFLVPIILGFLHNPRTSQEDSATSVPRATEGTAILASSPRGHQGLGGWSRRPIRRYAFTILPILFFALSFPTFLAHNSRISTDAYYSYEFTASQFIQSSSGEEPTIFSGLYARPPIRYHNLNAQYYGESELHQRQDESSLWRDMNELVAAFETSSGTSIFVFSPRMTILYQHLFGIEPTDRHWQDLERRLEKGGSIYDDGHTRVYVPDRRG